MSVLLTMRRLRHWLGLVALVLVCAQALPAALSGACCASATARVGVAGDDCCPAGSHEPGMCPLKHGARARANTSTDQCRLSCAAAGSMRLVLPAGVLPLTEPVLTPLMAVVSAPVVPPQFALDLSVVPHAPPPKA